VHSTWWKSARSVTCPALRAECAGLVLAGAMAGMGLEVRSSTDSQRSSASAVQEFLRPRNKPLKDTEEEAASVSLWHEMQRRDAPGSSVSSEAGEDLYPGQSTWGSPDGGGLFDSLDAQASSISKPRAAVWHTAQPLQAPPQQPLTGQQTQKPARTPGPVNSPAADLLARQSSGAELDNNGDGRKDSSGEPMDGRSAGSAAEQGMVACAKNDQLRSRGSGLRLSSSGDHSELSNSMVGNLISTVRSGISALSRVMAALPPSLRYADQQAHVHM
jgi:hypothetical protein